MRLLHAYKAVRSASPDFFLDTPEKMSYIGGSELYLHHSHHSDMSNKVFLSHIGGLRGIAIILVLLFHLCPALFPNCYYGVDIFLVITGYLLFLGAGRHDGTLKGAGVFALKKAERILPPLSVAVLLTVIAGIYFLDKTMLEATARLGRYALFGLSNNHLNKVVADYFDTTAALNPLLHTWYIGITLQVYLLFALGVLAYKRVSHKTAIRTMAVIGVLSLCWKYRIEIQSLFATMGLTADTDLFQAPTHYETHPRLWEILAGGAIMMLPAIRNKWCSSLMTLIGLACISTAFYLPNAEPVIVLGTMLIIAYAGGSKVEALLSNKLMLGVGAVSFSLYLVHMPVFAYYKSWIVVPPTLNQYICMSVIAVVLGILFWYLIEKRRFNWKQWGSLWIITMLLCVLAKKTSVIHDMVSSEAEQQVVKPYNDWHLATEESLTEGFDEKKLHFWQGMFTMNDIKCTIPLPAKKLFFIGDEAHAPNFVMMGDSHAGSLYSGFDQICRNKGCAGLYLPSVVSPFWNYDVYNDENYFCNREKMEGLLTWLQAQPGIQYVVVVQRWYQRCKANKLTWDKKKADLSLEAQTEGLREFLRQMRNIGKEVILVDQLPDFETNPRTYGKWCRRHNRNPEEAITPFLCSRERYETRHKDFLTMLDTVENEGLCKVLSFDKAITPDGNFTAFANGEVLYLDDNHPATPGSIYLMEKVAEDFFKLIQLDK